jgi:hypothetical protein
MFELILCFQILTFIPLHGCDHAFGHPLLVIRPGENPILRALCPDVVVNRCKVAECVIAAPLHIEGSRLRSRASLSNEGQKV